ncbi:hypothetical protein SOHN41_00767 [Shewanella sp. HN-41]|nr:hypothetical protein SOHN41_00767 [Shewanella sp. HN-41]
MNLAYWAGRADITPRLRLSPIVASLQCILGQYTTLFTLDNQC